MTQLHCRLNTHMFAAAAALLFASSSLSAFYATSLPGTTEYEGWSGLNSTNYTAPDYPTTMAGVADAWASPIVANEVGSAGNASFDKVSGGGYFIGSSIYSFMTPGTFTVSNASAVAGLETVVFQIEAVGTYLSAPTLSYNGGSQALAADITFSVAGDTATGFGESTVGVFQWDLSSVGVAITDYRITYTGDQHLSQIALQLDSGNTFAPVPEPSTYAGIAALFALGWAFVRRRRAC